MDKNGKGQFVDGWTGGPGRPKGSFSLVSLIKSKLQEKQKGSDKTYAESFIEKLMKKAIKDGDTATMRDMINRIDGLPRQNIGIDGGADGSPLVVNLINFKKADGTDNTI